MNTKDKIDIIIPVYNGASYIRRAIKSVIVQGSIVGKIIVVNDGSIDKTNLILKKIANNLKNIVIINQANLGLSAARNAGIRMSNSRYLAFLDIDDIWEKGKLIKQMNILKSNNKLGVVYCDYKLISKNKNIATDNHEIKFDARGNIYNYLLEGNCVMGSGSAVLIKKSCFNKVGYFDEKLPTCEDWDMWLKIAKFYEFDYVSDKLVNINVSKSSMSNNAHKMAIGMSILYDKHQELLKNKASLNYLYSIIIPALAKSQYKLKLIREIHDRISLNACKKIFFPSLLLAQHIFSNAIHLLVSEFKKVLYDY